ncbi:MAG TPA: hypothetical protein PKV72_04030 [Candidatus Peribacteria bacterium]|nr:hypothetical protein [Candidatus Peribacteria bacterium]
MKELSEALTELKNSGALVLPKQSTVEAAGMGKVWSGKKADGMLWTLTKHSPDSFTCTC